MIKNENVHMLPEHKETNVPVDWMSLPTEVWLNIFKHLPQSTLIFVLRHVCYYFRQIVFDPSLWKTIDMNNWKINTSTEMRSVNASCNESVDSDELNFALDLLPVEGQLLSSKIFMAISSQVQDKLSSITFSRYEGDFIFGVKEQSALLQCTNLTYIDASFCHEINSNSLHSLCSNCVKLTTLILEGCSNVTNDAVKSICNLRELKTLDISHCAGVTDSGLNHVMLMHARLKEFYCDGILHVTDFALIPFAQYQPEICAISLDGEHLHDISVVSILTHLPHLDSFEVSFCTNLTDITLSTLLRCKNNKFKQLHLKQLSHSLSSSLITELFQHTNMTLLQELSLTDCTAVLDAALNVISANCLLLELVRLDWCVSITDEGIQLLVNGCNRIKKLTLVGVKRLLGGWLLRLELILPRLTYLDLTQCDLISDDALRQLVKCKPDLTAYNYYHEDVATVLNDEIQLPSLCISPAEAPCPASQGAFVDF